MTEASLTTRFEENRARLRAMAYRMLGSNSEAEDAVQETWLRAARTDVAAVDNLGGFLTTVSAHVCLDLLRARKTREKAAPTLAEEPPSAPDPEREFLLADAVGSAMMIVLDTLGPAERVAFVLHDLFGLSFEDIGQILGRTVDATRQLASRARKRVQRAEEPEHELPSQREVAHAFMAASRDGNLEALLALLDPNVVLRVDPIAVKAAASRQAQGAPQLAAVMHGAPEVARAFLGRAQAAELALIDGTPGAAWAPAGVARALFAFKVEQGRIVEMQLLYDPKRIAELDVLLLDS